MQETQWRKIKRLAQSNQHLQVAHFLGVYSVADDDPEEVTHGQAGFNTRASVVCQKIASSANNTLLSWVSTWLNYLVSFHWRPRLYTPLIIIPHFLHFHGLQAFCHEYHPEGGDDGNMFVTPSWALQFLDWAVDGKTPKADGHDAIAAADVHEEHDDDSGEEEDQLQEEEEEEEVLAATEPTRHNQQAEPRTSKQGLYPKRYKKEVSNCTLKLVCW